ncbi:RNA helicase, partial [Sarracenia purpurea var. burkii]
MAEDREVKSLKDLEVCNQLVEAFDNLGWNLETPIQDASQSHSSCAKAPEGNPVKIEAAFKHSTLDDTLKQQYLFVPAKHK